MLFAHVTCLFMSLESAAQTLAMPVAICPSKMAHEQSRLQPSRFPLWSSKPVSEWPLEIYHPMDRFANGVSTLPSWIFSSLDAYHPASLDSFLCFPLIFYIAPGLSGFNLHLQMDSHHGLSLGSQRLRPSIWARCSLLGSRP